MGLVQYNLDHDLHVVKKIYTGSNTLVTGQPVQVVENADPTNAAFASSTPGAAVTDMGADDQTAVFAGVVAPSSNGATTNDIIDVIIPKRGDVVVLAVTAATDVGDGVVLQERTNAATQCFLDGDAWATGDAAYLLHDEDNANNPFGTTALGSSRGLAYAIWTMDA